MKCSSESFRSIRGKFQKATKEQNFTYEDVLKDIELMENGGMDKKTARQFLEEMRVKENNQYR
ncbi:hypothetical protein [Metabacillus endolithicus]|uniref:Uncharacterized protein n=1 Tax=Metabacillus endolithicus TaxID=1535204 RepID=A0ABW5C3V7_9BACI|nr:hypothetical protein [Metabacillus endolithicus]UPG66158.1 hypothetical protein MVE64_25965 [Metabacillus endolithicus]